MAETVELTRKALYHAIWELPPTHVANKLGISYQKIKKACEETNIPYPPSDYHLKRAKGIKLSIPPLPPHETEILEFTKIISRAKKSSDYSNRHIPLCVLRILESWSDENNYITMSEIIRFMNERYQLKVGRSTIYKAIDTLQDMNFKVYGYEDNNGLGYNYERPLKPSHIKLIIESLALNPLIPSSKEMAIIDALNKHMSLSNAIYNRRGFTSDFLTKCKHDFNFFTAVEAIDMALIQHKKIEFDYWTFNTDGSLIPAKDSHFTLAPCKILISEQSCYLRCFNQDRSRTILFRINQMRNVTVTEEGCDNLPGCSKMEIYADEHLNAYNDIITVSFRCDNFLIGTANDLFSDSFTQPCFSDNNNGKAFTVTGRIHYQKALCWAMTNADKAVVLEPKRLYDEVCEKLKNNLYTSEEA